MPFNDTSGYTGLGKGIGTILASLLMKRPLEMREQEDKEKDEVKRAGELLSFYVDTANKLNIPLNDYISQLPKEALEPLHKAQKTTGQYLANIVQNQKPQGVTFTRGMPTTGQAAPLSALAGAEPMGKREVTTPAQASSAFIGAGTLPVTRSVPEEQNFLGQYASAYQGPGMSPAASFVTPQTTTIEPEFQPPQQRPKGLKKEAYRKYLSTIERQKPYGLTAPEFEYQYGGAPVAPTEAKKWQPIYPTVWDPGQIVKTQSVFPKLSMNDVEYLASSYPVGDEDSLNSTLRQMNEDRIKDEDAKAKGEKVEPAEERARKIAMTGFTSARNRAGIPEGITIANWDSNQLTAYADALRDFYGPYLERPEMIGKYTPQDYLDVRKIWMGTIPKDIDLVRAQNEDLIKGNLKIMGDAVIRKVVGDKHSSDWTDQEFMQMQAILEEKYGNSYETLDRFIRDYLSYYPEKPKPIVEPQMSAPGTKGKVKAK